MGEAESAVLYMRYFALRRKRFVRSIVRSYRRKIESVETTRKSNAAEGEYIRRNANVADFANI